MFNLSKHTINDGSIPVVLIDKSGSTSSTIVLNNGSNTILKQQLITMKEYFEENNISKIYLMLWNGTSQKISDDPIDLKDMENINAISEGSTIISNVINEIPEKWLNQGDNTNIYICSDGEIGDDEYTFMKSFESLIKHNISLFIRTFETNSKDYLMQNCESCTTLYKYIKKNKMTNYINSFVSYNSFYKNGFSQLSNYKTGPNYIPYNEYYFSNNEIYKFIEYIEKILQTKTEDFELLKIAHELSNTLHHITKDKSPHIKRQYINLFSNLFSETSVYNHVRALFLEETINHAEGTSTTFQEYLNNRNTIFEQSQMSLYSNVKKAVQISPTDNFMSVLVNIEDEKENKMCVINVPSDSITENVQLSDKIYVNAGVGIGNFIIPTLPKISSKINENDDTVNKYQCVRQWIRTIYGKKFKLNPSSDMIPYYFYADTLSIMLSDVSEEIKISYRRLAFIMLLTERYGTEMTEYEYLMSNPPLTVNSISENKIISILKKVTKYANMADIKPYTWWFAFISSLKITKLAKTQYEYCKKDIEADGLTYDTIMDTLKSKKSKNLTEMNLKDIEQTLHWDYECYYSLEDTKEVGGYGVPSHQIGSQIICSPKLMLSKESYSLLKDENIKCPICCKELESSSFNLIESEKVELEKLKKSNKKKLIASDMISEELYKISKIEEVPITDKLFERESKAEELIELDSCDFDVDKYVINKSYMYVQDPIGCRHVEITKQEKFNNLIGKRYSFLSDLDWKGVCVAGGFCRSILLRQQLKDIDFFCYGSDNETNFARFSKELMEKIKVENPDMKFLLLFKPLYNVFEIVCLNDPNNIIKDNMKLDNYKNYHFNNLQPYDSNVIIDIKNNTVETNLRKIINPSGYFFGDSVVNNSQISDYIENNEFSNYFEDGDEKGVKMKYRLQFILTENKSIKNVLAGFDLYPSRVAWDGKTTWLTAKSQMAYRYMINIINIYNASDLLSSRIKKYFAYGFSPVFQNFEGCVIGSNMFLPDKVAFNVIKIIENKILVEHNSFFTEKMNKIIKLETQSKERGVQLYKSSLFCTLVALLRYVKINKINYMFSENPIEIAIGEKINFTEDSVEINFIKNIESRYNDETWKNNFISLNVNNKNDQTVKNNRLIYIQKPNASQSIIHSIKGKKLYSQSLYDTNKENKVCYDSIDFNLFQSYGKLIPVKSYFLGNDNTKREIYEKSKFMFHSFAQFYPSTIICGGTTKKRKEIPYRQRNFMKVPIYTDQTACLDFKKQIKYYDQQAVKNKEVIFGTYSKLFNFIPSTKTPRGIDEMDRCENDPIPEYEEYYKIFFDMGYNYYLDGTLLDNDNVNIIKNALERAKKTKLSVVKLFFTDEYGNLSSENIKLDSTRLEKRQNKINLNVIYRCPSNIPPDAKKISDCTEDELVKYYGPGKIMNLNTIDDLSKYYHKNCYIRILYSVSMIAHRDKQYNSARTTRDYFNKFVCKAIDIIDTKNMNLTNQVKSSGAFDTVNISHPINKSKVVCMQNNIATGITDPAELISKITNESGAEICDKTNFLQCDKIDIFARDFETFKNCDNAVINSLYSRGNNEYLVLEIKKDNEDYNELEKTMNEYDDILEDKKSIILGKYAKNHILDPNIVENSDKNTKYCKFGIEKNQSYYYENKKLDARNQLILKYKLKMLEYPEVSEYGTSKSGSNIGDQTVELYFTNGKIKYTKMVNISDIVKEENYTVLYRESSNKITKRPKLNECSDKELDKYYGPIQELTIKDKEELKKKLIGKKSFIRFTYKPRIIAYKAENGKRYYGCDLVCGGIEIIKMT